MHAKIEDVHPSSLFPVGHVHSCSPVPWRTPKDFFVTSPIIQTLYMVNYEHCHRAVPVIAIGKLWAGINMSKVLVSEAVRLTGKSTTTINRHVKEGILSADKDVQGRRVIPVVELERVYGKLHMSENGAGNDGHVQEDTIGNGEHVQQDTLETSGHVQRDTLNGDGHAQRTTSENNGHEYGQVVAVLEEQVAVLKEQLELANAREQEFAEREQEYSSREQQLIDLLKTEQKKSEMLMLPKPKPKGSFWNYIRWKR